MRRPSNRAMAGLAAAAAVAIGAGGIIFGSSQGGSIDVFVGSTPTPTPAFTCDLSATTANFSTQVAAATTGDTVCLASGAYGNWAGTDKEITVAADTGATVTFSGVTFQNGDCCFTMDGEQGSMTIGPDDASITSTANYTHKPTEPHLIRFRHVNFTGIANIDYIVETIPATWDYTIRFQNTTHNDIDFSGGRIRLPYDDNEVNSGVEIDAASMSGGCADGVNAGPGFSITNSDLGPDITERVGGPAFCEPDTAHTDPIQFFGRGAAVTIIDGNWVHENVDGIAAYDGTGNATITDNVVTADSAGRCLEVYYDNSGTGDDPSTVAHNTVYGSGCQIALSHKTIHPAGAGTIVKNNITPGGVTLTSQDGNPPFSTAGVNTHNMFTSGASSPNFNGTPTFIGGVVPTTHGGFCLAPGSAGENAGDDGLDVGVRC